MTCPNCSCEKCRAAGLKSALAKIVARETDDGDMRRAFDLQPRSGRFREPRELGKPMVDPDAEQLAGEVGVLAGEMRRDVA